MLLRNRSRALKRLQTLHLHAFILEAFDDRSNFASLHTIWPVYSEGYAGILLQFVGQSSFDFVVFLSHKHKQTNLFLWIIIRNNTSILPRAQGGGERRRQRQRPR